MRPMGPPPGPPPGLHSFLTDEEKQHKTKVDKNFIIRIFSYLLPYKKQMAVILLINLVSAGIGLLPAIITAKIVDEALYQKNLQLLLILIGLNILALACSSLLSLSQRHMNSWLSQQVIYDMKNQMFEHLQKMSHSFFTSEQQGDVITRMTSDIEGVQSVITDTLTTLISNILIIITTIVAMVTMCWQLALVGIVVVPLMQIPSRMVAKKRWLLLKKAQAKKDELNGIVNETLSVSGSMLVKLYNREELENQRFRGVNREVTNIILKEQRSGQRFFALLGVFTQLGPILIYLAGGLLLILGSENSSSVLLPSSLSVGTIIAVVALVSRLYGPVSSLLDVQVNVTRSFALFERIFDYYDMPVTIKNPEHPVDKDRAKGDIRFSHVNFAYNPEKPILKDVSFTVPQGTSYALVGPSGSGKSTLISLITRLYDTNSGSVSIGGINVKDYDLNVLRSSIGVVTQDTYLFNGTIRENLLYANENATEDDLIRACKMANIHDFIMSLPDKYDSRVGNRGLKLSGGEKQRVSIARVILKDPEILILDEATSSLDSIVEHRIQEDVEQLLNGRTSLIIAHRLSTVVNADCICVVKDGELLEQGSHQDLLTNSEMYRELYETQFREMLEAEARMGK